MTSLVCPRALGRIFGSPQAHKYPRNQNFQNQSQGSVHSIQKHQKERKWIIYDFPGMPQRFRAHFGGLLVHKFPENQNFQNLKNQLQGFC